MARQICHRALRHRKFAMSTDNNIIENNQKNSNDMNDELTRLGTTESPIKENPEANYSEENNTSEKSENGKNIATIAASAVAGAALGAGAMALTSATAADDAEIESIVVDDDAEFNGTAPMSHAVTDDMTFGDAFAAARADVGCGGTFLWHGGVYGTYNAAEWNELTADEQAAWQSTIRWNEVAEYQSSAATTTDEPMPAIEDIDGQSTDEEAEQIQNPGDESEPTIVEPEGEDAPAVSGDSDSEDLAAINLDETDFIDIEDPAIDETIYNDI